VIIDDDLDVLETTGALLEDAGFEIHTSDTVEDGMGLIDESSPDLVLLDLLFPEDTSLGFETAKIIKHRYPDLPLFVLTSINREYALDFSREDLHADEIVIKPIQTSRLIELIQRYVS
jgi:CheY-like chemotaxis protein